MSNIKNCPFCGAEAEIRIDEPDCPSYDTTYAIECVGEMEHRLDHWEKTKEEIIKVWNERTTQA